MDWKVEAKSRWSWSRSIGSEPRGPVVGEMPRLAQKWEKWLPSSMSGLLHRAASVVRKARTSLGCRPYGRPTSFGARIDKVKWPFRRTELVGLGVAVRQCRLHQRPGQEPDLAGGVSVLLVEEKRLADQAPGAPGLLLNNCWMKLRRPGLADGEAELPGWWVAIHAAPSRRCESSRRWEG